MNKQTRAKREFILYKNCEYCGYFPFSMDILKENDTVSVINRGSLKNKTITSSTSKKLNVLSDVRNTVHKKHAGTSSFSKQFLEPETRLELRTPSPDRKMTPLVIRDDPKLQKLPDDLDDRELMWCPCYSNYETYNDNYLPDICHLTEDDIDNLAQIWYGQGGRLSEDKSVFTPVKFERDDIDWDALMEKVNVNEIPLNDSGIDLDVELEMDEISQDF